MGMARVIEREAGFPLAVPRPAPVERRRRAAPLAAWGYLLPAFAIYVVFWIGPAAYSLYLSFFDWDMASPVKTFVFLDNYRRVLTDPVAWTALRNTLVYVAATVVLGTAVGLGLALLVQALPRGRALYRFVLFLPVVTSITVVTLVWLFLLNTQVGPINVVLRALGVRGPNWLNDPTTALLGVVLVGLWKGFGYNVVLFTAGLTTIDREVYEAAAIDGAGRWGVFRHVTWPLLSPVTLFVVVISVIASFQVFATVQIMTKGGPANATNVLVYHVWESAFRFFDVGYAAALATLMALLVAAVTVVQIRRGEARVHYQ
jgi:ABC-type sugar transport system permease subunit